MYLFLLLLSSIDNDRCIIDFVNTVRHPSKIYVNIDIKDQRIKDLAENHYDPDDGSPLLDILKKSDQLQV